MSSLDDRIKECPHCFSRVLVTSEGNCPTCWGDTRLPNASGRVRYRVEVGAQLPRLCVVCGEATRKTLVVTDQLGEEAGFQADESALQEVLQAGIAVFLAGPLAILSKLFGFNRNTSGHVVRQMSLKVPRCWHCRKEEVRVLDANHDMGTMVIAAQERFIDANDTFRASDQPG